MSDRRGAPGSQSNPDRAETPRSQDHGAHSEDGSGRTFRDRVESVAGTTKKLLIVVALLGAGALIAAAIVPRWWSQFLGGIIDGKLTSGSIVGVAVGFVFTLAPLMMMAWGVRARPSGSRILWFAVPTVVLAMPNLFTLWVVLGAGGAARAGERTMDVEAPGVRGGSLVGSIAGVLLFAWLQWLLWHRRKQKSNQAQAKTEARTRG